MMNGVRSITTSKQTMLAALHKIQKLGWHSHLFIMLKTERACIQTVFQFPLSHMRAVLLTP